MRIRFPRWRRSRQPELVCQQVVELVTDYLEDALSAEGRQWFERHLASCRIAPSTWPRCGRRSGWRAGSPRRT